MNLLKPTEEIIDIDPSYNWTLPLRNFAKPSRTIKSVWYLALPISSAHRGGHSGGGALIEGIDGQERYLNEGTVYPHSSLVELITYHQTCFPFSLIPWKYIDLSHDSWFELRELISNSPPDVAAFSVYTSTAIWAYIVAAEIKRINPRAIIIFGNDHASLLRQEILFGTYGKKIVDFIGLDNNGPFTMMGLLYALQGQMELAKVPSLAYRKNGTLVEQTAPTYPLDQRILPDYRLIEDYMAKHYDQAFHLWYSHHYELKRMVTFGIDGGCQGGKHPKRRCQHCSIQGLTPKVAALEKVIPTLESIVGELHSNVYAAGDSTLGFSKNQWQGTFAFLDQLAEACENSSVLRSHRFMLAYGLVSEFIKSAEICKGFIRTWNVGIETFDSKLLKSASKGINRGKEHIYDALELARELDYRLYVSGILGLPNTTVQSLAREVEDWLTFAEMYQDIVTTLSVSLPSVIPGSRMYWDIYNNQPEVREWHGEFIPCHKLSKLYIKKYTEVEIEDVQAALNDIAKGTLSIAQNGGNPLKFGGYMMGGIDAAEMKENELLKEIVAQLD